MINHLANLLDKFKNLRDPKEEREKIAAILSRTLNFEVTEAQVSLSKGMLVLKVDSYLKSEIYINKESLLKALNDSGISVNEIR